MRTLFCAVALLSGVFAQSLSPTSISITGGAVGTSTGSAQALTLTTSGAWSVTQDPTGLVHLCIFNANGNPNGSSAESCPDAVSGSGNQVFRVYAKLNRNLGSPSYLTAGTYSRSFTVAGITVPVTVMIGEAHFPPVYFDAAGDTNATRVSRLGCSYSDASHLWIPYPDNCPNDGEAPVGTYKPGALGTWFTDQLYGGPIFHFADTNLNYTNLDLCSDETTPLCLIDAFNDSNVGFYELTTGRTTPLYTNPPFSGSTQFLPWHRMNAAFGLPDRTVWGFNNSGLVRATAGTPPNWNSPVVVWPTPAGFQAGSFGNNPQDGQTQDGWIPVWGCQNGVSPCSASDGTMPLASYRYIWTVNKYTGQSCSFDMTDPRVVIPTQYANPYLLQTRDVAIFPFNPDNWSYIRIESGDGSGARISPSLYFKWKHDCSWEWIGPRFTDSFTQAQDFALQSDCPSKGLECLQGSHHTQGFTGAYPFQWQPYFNDFKGMKVTLLDETLNSVSAIESGGAGPKFLGGYTMDHPHCIKSYPLCVAAIEAGFGEDNAPATTIASASGNAISLTDSGAGTITTSNSVVVGCNTNAYPSMYGVFPVSTVAGLNLTLGGGFDGTGYSFSTHPCTVMIQGSTVGGYNHSTYHAQEGLAVARLDANGYVIQVATLLSLMGTRNNNNAYYSECHSVLTEGGQYALCGTNAGYGNYLMTLAAPVPWQMRAERQECFAPGNCVDARSTGSGALFISMRVPDSRDISCTFGALADLSDAATPTVFAGPASARSATISGLTAGQTYHWQCKSAEGWYVAVGHVNVR